MRTLFSALCFSLALPLVASRAGAGDDPEFVDLHGIRKAFAEELGRMLEAGEPVAIGPLREELTEEMRAVVRTKRGWRRRRRAQSVYQRSRDSVVIVGKIFKCGKCSKWHSSVASGFVVGQDGEVVTSYHVLGADKRGEAIAVRSAAGEMLPVTGVVACSKRDDLLVLRVPGAKELPPLALAKPATVGTRVLCVGHPVDHYYTMTEGIVSANFTRPARGNHESRREMAITADFAKGSSGGPIMDMTGAVVGVVRSTSPVYYEVNEGKGDKIQMVWKLCVPSSALIDLVSGK